MEGEDKAQDRKDEEEEEKDKGAATTSKPTAVATTAFPPDPTTSPFSPAPPVALPLLMGPRRPAPPAPAPGLQGAMTMTPPSVSLAVAGMVAAGLAAAAGGTSHARWMLDRDQGMMDKDRLARNVLEGRESCTIYRETLVENWVVAFEFRVN